VKDMGSQSASEHDDGKRRLISSGSKYEDIAAYSRAVIDGNWIFISGTVGLDPQTGAIPDGFDEQMDCIFSNMSYTLAQAGATLADIVRVRCFLIDKSDIESMAKGLNRYLGKVRPANTTVIVELPVEGARIEIEVTALRRSK
jgi:enamine deaminase RidA (YjgF/YER057c/UK114 family)